MQFALEALGNYIQKPAPVNVLDSVAGGPDLHAIYDASGFCVGAVVLSPKVMTPQGYRVLVLDLRVEPHIPIKQFLLFIAARFFKDVSVLLYQRRKPDRVVTKQIVAGPRSLRWTSSHLADLYFSTEPDAARIPFHRRACVKDEQREAQQFGKLFTALIAGRAHLALPLDQLLARLRTWIVLQQFMVFEHPDGRPSGVITWAWLDREVLSGAPPLGSLHPSRWNEGTVLCLCDVVLTPEILKAAQHFVMTTLFPGEAELWVYPRHQQAGFQECTKMTRESAAAWLAENMQAFNQDAR